MSSPWRFSFTNSIASLFFLIVLSCPDLVSAESPTGVPAAVNLETLDPAVRTTLARQADPSRVKVIDNPRYEDPAVEAAARAALPCQNIAYRNLPTSQTSIYLFGGPPGADNVADDCTLPPGSPNRFICGAQVTTLGFAQDGPPTYNLTVQVWSDCPDEPGAVLLSQGAFYGIPNDGIQRVQTVTVDPPVTDVDDTFWVLCQSDNPDAAWEIARAANGVNDVGSTLDIVGTSSGTQGGCIFFFWGGNPVAGLTCTLYGSAGPAGSCCDLNTGVCTDGVLLTNCSDALNQYWNKASCGNGPPCVACTLACAFPGPNPPNREQEGDCFTNYNPAPFTSDPNKGCSNFTERAIGRFWTPLNCTTATSGCGRSGTYTFLNVFVQGGAQQQVVENRRDDDHYLLELTQDSRVTWTVKGRFPSQAIVSFTLKQTNGLSTGVNCPTFVATEPGDVSITGASPCNEAVATACLPGRDGPEGPFRYFLRARPAVPKLGVNALCGLPYEYTLTCEPCVRAPSAAELGACCTTTACVYTSRLACLILTGDDGAYFQGEGTTCPSSACTGVPANDTCLNKSTLTCSSCIVTYDTTFAGSEGQSFGSGGQVFKDVWYKYTVPQPGACANGRVVVSNIGTCFNSKIHMLRVSNCNASQTTQCNGLSIIGGISMAPIQLESGPPIVNIGPFVYGRSSQTIIPGNPNGCVKLRVGGLTENDFGPGVLRVDFVCNATSDAGQAAWNANAGRCCFPDGSCQILPNIGTGTLFDCCGVAGGFIRNKTDFYEGQTPPPIPGAGEIDGVGCATLPCPAQGEACFNAWDLNALFGGDEGTLTRQSTNRIYYKYVVPMSAPVGSGIAINTCGSRQDPSSPIPTPLDTAFAVYRGQFSSITGECDGTQSAGVAPCVAAYNNTEIARVESCGPQDGRSAGANGHAPCYGLGEVSACLCLQVISSLGTPTAGQVRQGDTIYIGVGAGKSESNGDSTRPFFDPIRSECGGPVEYQVKVANVAACSTCSLNCPLGATPNPEPLPSQPCTNYADVTNAGCSTSNVVNQLFTPISCGETYCGSSATYAMAEPCGPTTCPPGQTCVSGFCQDPNGNERKDHDFYRVHVTQPSRLTWTVNATFATALQIIHSPTDSCLDQTVVASTINITQCGTTVVTAEVCTGFVYLAVAPANEVGVPCGSLYYATLSCDPVSSACCRGDMNNDGIVDGRDIRPWINQLLPVVAGGLSAAELDPTFGCLDVLTCRADIDSDYSVTLSDLAGFVVLLLDGDTCDLTVCDDSAACHVPSAGDSGLVSNLLAATPGIGSRCADDFRVTDGTSLSSLCWYGFYFDFNSGTRCGVPSGDSADQFVVTIYDDASGLPGNSISGPTTLSTVTKTDTGVDLNYLQNPVRRFKYEATLPAAVAVSPGTCYWIEIVNHTSGQCLWLWETSALSGNGVCAQKSSGPAGTMNWFSFDLVIDDLSFCLPGLRIENQDCGLPLGRCCVYLPLSNNGDCSIQIQSVCEIVMGGIWKLGTDCSLGCPIIPANDFCANAFLITSGPIYSGSTQPPATPDGPAISCETSCTPNCNTANDVWYKWVATANGNATFTMCDAWQGGANINGVPIYTDDFRYDSIMAVYDNCPSLGGIQLPGGCNDDSCGTGASSVSQVTITTAVVGRTYWVRITGWQGTNGMFVLRANQP